MENAKTDIVEGLDAPIHSIQIESIKTIFFKYFGEDELFVNGQIIDSDKVHVFNVGSTVRSTKSSQIFYSDIVSKFSKTKDFERLSFEMSNVIHSFKSGTKAVRQISFSTNDGKMIGIMGGSGTGKTTLLNIMNGKVKPTFGKVEINGINLHDDFQNKLEGIIGNVSQNDLLIEDLTVFDNLYFSAKLCLNHLDQNQLTKKVVNTLKSLGLYESRRLKVGSTLDKVISGGQRKRLNIALELIREPSILFVDEPTSGLSSRDSENIMDLLKEISLSGKIVFVVIHQPSSNIFKLFDRLLIMDKGGFPIFDGNPLSAIVHFKKFSYRGNAHERECGLCGNVNPELIFNLIDAKIIDEYGNETRNRKKEPRDWNKIYLDNRTDFESEKIKDIPNSGTKLPSKLSQFTTYLQRDFLSKISNRQYIILNSLVAPILAFALSYFIKFYGWINGNSVYSYFKNENIPQYIFISVIVMIFIGLTVAAEEINKDKKILAREEFLNLSRHSYLFSKIFILFGISAIQSMAYVLIGNSILEIKGMWFEYWAVLFTASCLSNLAGLNISSAFNSAKVIYIFVPLLIIPQLLFSGVIVKFDKLHPSLSNATEVPAIGNMMVSRWAYEALTVEQVAHNKLEDHYFANKLTFSKLKWKKDFWLPEMQSQVNLLLDDKNISTKEHNDAVEILFNEIQKEEESLTNFSCIDCLDDLKNKPMNTEEELHNINEFLSILKLNSITKINKQNDIIQGFIDSIGVDQYKIMQSQYINESLNDLLSNRMEKNKFILSDNQIFQNDDPIYNNPTGVSFFSTHYYSPYKYFFGNRIDTFTANLVIMWLIALASYLVLYFDLIRKSLEKFTQISKRIRYKGE